MTETAYQLGWYGCDLRTGGIIEDLRSIKPTGTLSRKLGDSTTLQLELALPGAPADWDGATAPGRSILVAVDTVTDTPIWAGAVITRGAGSTQTVQLGAMTLEGYLNGRYPGTQGYFGVDQASVITGLVTPALTDGPTIVIDAPPTGTTMTYQSDDGDDKTILSCLQEIMGMDGGPEWTIDVAWNAAHSGFQFFLRVRPKIGIQATSPTVFDFPGCVSGYTLSESFEAGKGATVVIARGEGEGSSRLTSTSHVATSLIAAGWPRWEYRYTPATGVTDPTQLEAHAAQTLALMQQGGQVWDIEAVGSRAPRLGRDWAIGDTIQLAVDTSPRHPQGVTQVARCWSWELDPSSDSVHPILVQED
ncbi:hypothetical protein [Streptomyces griseofuscus]|uniref:Uncharacterized protein n=1 Tax=Streptomyces griseofuscus TaxID=146922 RepID=A0A426RZ53_9ACTN|nr:hypothetical protein [Streptomyces griseofuscus]RRQ81571.1 hypothetical protein CQW44_30695 [Streptomyces griseofuscus]